MPSLDLLFGQPRLPPPASSRLPFPISSPKALEVLSVPAAPGQSVQSNNTPSVRHKGASLNFPLSPFSHLSQAEISTVKYEFDCY